MSISLQKYINAFLIFKTGLLKVLLLRFYFFFDVFSKALSIGPKFFTVIFAHFIQMTPGDGVTLLILRVSPKPVKFNQNFRLLNVFSRI